MTTKKGDSKGYYKILGVSPSVTAAEIKRAYHVRAKELHPDKNPGKDTTRQFQRLQEAFNVLKNPKTRAQYDAQGTQFQEQETPFYEKQHHPAHKPPQYSDKNPIRCVRCGSISAQPRFVIFFEVKSFFLVSEKTPIEGVFCSKCASLVSLKASLTTWILGWWGFFPWGVLWSFQVLVTNLLGGIRPPHINAIILAHQASYFKRLGNLALAKAIIRDACHEAEKFLMNPSSYYLATAAFYEHQEEIVYLREFQAFYEDLKKLDASINLKNPKRLRSQWGIFNRVFLVQFMAIVIFLSLVLEMLK